MEIHPTTEQIAWAAGLFEGEGCWNAGVRKSGKFQIQARLGMTDRDVVERFMRVVGCGAISLHNPPAHQAKGWKPMYQWAVYEAVKVRAVIEMFMPYLGNRRRAAAERVLVEGASIQSHNAKKTHCPKGHDLSGVNLMLEPFTGINGVRYMARRCRECRTVQSRARARKRLLILPENYRIKEATT